MTNTASFSRVAQKTTEEFRGAPSQRRNMLPTPASTNRVESLPHHPNESLGLMGGTDQQPKSPTRVTPQKKNKWASFRLFVSKIFNGIKRPFQKHPSRTSPHTGRAQHNAPGSEGHHAQRPVSNGITFSEPTPTRPDLLPLYNVSTQMMSSPDPLSPRPISKRKTRPATEYQRVCKRHKPNEVVHGITTIFKQDDSSSFNFGKRFFIHSITSTSKLPIPTLSSFINERLKCRMQLSRLAIPYFTYRTILSKKYRVGSRNTSNIASDHEIARRRGDYLYHPTDVDTSKHSSAISCSIQDLIGSHGMTEEGVPDTDFQRNPNILQNHSMVAGYLSLIAKDDWMISRRIDIPDFLYNLNNSQDPPTVSSRNGTTPEEDEIESGSEAGSDSSCESIDSQDPQIVPACNWIMVGGNRIRPANVVSYNCLSAPGDSDGSSIVSSHNGIMTEDDWMESGSEAGSSCSYESSNSQDSLTVSSCNEITSENDEMESGSETGSSCSYESSNSQDSLTVSSCNEITSENDEMESGSETSFF
ncbi:hypothetical protein BASA62_006632 [Batrachochytrium salamandrivorans]|nr:hypothetical protein BASA62_006632 [Batrachochytrium salamandrivorans]